MTRVSPYSAEADLERRLAFERTISKVSTRFIMPNNNFDETVQQSLEDIGRLSQADRTYIFQFTDNLSNMNNTYEWCAEGVQAEIDNLQDLPTEIFPWWMSKLTHHEMIVIPKVSALPEVATSEREILSAQGIESVLVLPITTHGDLYGYIGLDNVHAESDWASDDFVLLKMASDIFGSAFQRLEYERQLIENNKSLSHAVEESQRFQFQLIQQEKMVGIGQLAAGIAHEINNPLGFAISNYEVLYSYADCIHDVLQRITELTQLAERNVSVDFKGELIKLKSKCLNYNIEMITNDVVELLQDSKIGFDRVGKIITSLRNFAHPDDQSLFEEEDLHEIINEVLIILNNEIKYTAELICDFKAQSLVWCHRGQLGQVIINLITNALHAIRGVPKTGLGHLFISTWEENELFYISIADDGAGIPNELAHEVFNPFFTTKGIGEGTGLGLSISYDIIVNKHGGQIGFESLAAGGTIFTLKLPIHYELEADANGTCTSCT